MTTYKRFEDLPVWQAAAELFERCDDFLERAPARLRNSVRDQLERAVLSISNNIAEGFERGTTNELLAFLHTARGSAGEVRSMLAILLRRTWMVPFKGEVEEMVCLVESCSRQLRAWTDSLQNSEIAGTRHLSDKSRSDWKHKQARKAGASELFELQRKEMLMLPPAHPFRAQWEQKHGPLE